MNFAKLSLALAVALVSVAAKAAPTELITQPTGPNKVPGISTPDADVPTVTRTLFSEVASKATLDFVVQGFRSLDGFNTYQDVLTLTINSQVVGVGSFNLGGGGPSSKKFGSTKDNVEITDVNGGFRGTDYTAITWDGGLAKIKGVSFDLIAGNNTFIFSYIGRYDATANITDNGKFGQSGPANLNSAPSSYDEAWGIKSASVTAVPEPETYALMLAGLGMMGFIARRRRAG